MHFAQVLVVVIVGAAMPIKKKPSARSGTGGGYKAMNGIVEKLEMEKQKTEQEKAEAEKEKAEAEKKCQEAEKCTCWHVAAAKMSHMERQVQAVLREEELSEGLECKAGIGRLVQTATEFREAVRHLSAAGTKAHLASLV
jgi:hypothetical protein